MPPAIPRQWAVIFSCKKNPKSLYEAYNYKEKAYVAYHFKEKSKYQPNKIHTRLVLRG
nr:MAG TPA: hypothetical protein [Caudoviricetes sp.]